MRKADRLFQILQILRRETRAVTADSMAAELETSKRSVYRDIAALIGQRVPIRGEAGVGYVLEGGFDMPPLMLTVDEIEAVALGVQWVAGHADPALRVAARDVVAKLTAVIPERMRGVLADPSTATPPSWREVEDAIDMARLRNSIRRACKLRLHYTDQTGRPTERTVWPLLIAFLEGRRVLVGWCELRCDYRSFRLDRVTSVEFLDERIPNDPQVLRRRWRATLNRRSAPADG